MIAAIEKWMLMICAILMTNILRFRHVQLPMSDHMPDFLQTCPTGLIWLPTKLAEWIGLNLGDELGIPQKQGSLWTASELNAIITGNLIGGDHGHLQTFGCIQWECERFNGRPKALCYPFDIDGHRFRNKNPQVPLI